MIADPSDPVAKDISAKVDNSHTSFSLHPLDQLSTKEINTARDVILQSRVPAPVTFRNIALEEPPKAELLPYLAAERNQELTPETPKPPRLARVLYDIVSSEHALMFCDSVVDVETKEEISYEIVDRQYHAPLSGFVHATPSQRCILS